MAYKDSRRQSRYSELRAAYFTPSEARELSKLPRTVPTYREVGGVLVPVGKRAQSLPARDLMIQERLQRRARFEKIASTKIALGKWRAKDLHGKWIKNLSRMYTKLSSRVKEGPVGDQQKMRKGQPNPWALYRKYQRRAPDPQGYNSPWRKVSRRSDRVTKDMVQRQRESKKRVELRERRPYR